MLINQTRFALCLIAWVALVQVHSPLVSSLSQQMKLTSLIPKRSPKELEMDIKMLLHKTKIRQVPLVKLNNERILNEKLAEKRELLKQIDDLQNAIESHTQRKLPKVESPSPDRSDRFGRRTRFAKLTEKDVQEWRAQLQTKQKQLSMVRAQIQESKNIIAHPESYISVPSNYGALEPEEVQKALREELLRDRLIMNRRTQIQRRMVELPAFLADKW